MEMKEVIESKDISFALDILNQWKDEIMKKKWSAIDEEAFKTIESLLLANYTD